MFGTQNVYNPWSVVNYVSEAVSGVQFPKPYWSNTSSNSIIKELVERADLKQREELESLIAGAAIDKPIHEDITYEDIYKSEDNLWNFLLFTGYLKMIDRYLKEDSWYATMAIPNTEVKYIYRNTVMAWSDRKIGARDFKEFFRVIVFEIKTAASLQEMEEECQKALTQIADRKYCEELRQEVLVKTLEERQKIVDQYACDIKTAFPEIGSYRILSGGIDTVYKGDAADIWF